MHVSTLAALVALLATACSSSTSPADRALDGPWTTAGHACLTLGLDLTWTSGKVSGSGTYRTDTGPTNCTKPPSLAQLGTVTFTASRKSSTAIAGTMTFGTGVRATVTGTLVSTAGGAHIDATVVTADGSSIPVTLFEGVVP